MRHRARNTRTSGLERARADLREQLESATARLSGLIRAARDHARDPRGAGAALERIATERLYRVLGHASFGSFVQAELGISRATAHRIRAQAAPRSAVASLRRREAEAAATDARDWLRALGIRGPRVAITRWRGAPSVQLVLTPSEVARLPGERRRRR